MFELFPSAKRRKRNINDGASIAMENVTSGDEPVSQISTLPTDIPISTSPTLPELPTNDTISLHSNDSEDYYAASDRPIEQTGIFTEKDVCLILNIKKAKWYSRWMGTIPDSKGDKKYVMLTTVSEKVIRSKQIHWNEFIKRNIDLPTTKHLVNVEGIAVLQGRFHLVQELHVTETLESRLAKVSIRGETQIPMHLSEVIQLMDGILEGMNVIHSYGFLHPGLSTKKIILAGEGHIKLYDFCLAKDTRNIIIFNKSKLSRSLNNFAPEAMYRNEYSSPADVWSTAVVIWELLTGKLPFPPGQDGKDFGDLLAITPVETQVTKYEQLKNKLLFQCWHLPCPLRPTIPELRESYTKIFDRFKDDSYEIPRSDLYTSMTKTNPESDDEDYTDNYTVAS
ncbi:tyrosine-protein kinase FRK-like isoform X1 [Apostichopus japonicus]|uniref:tyrosine-protein kinase FRK-like isoform X1 n=2 Tax=Stichopus japonicus TaxID=307972 RepID=UPI003AB22707